MKLPESARSLAQLLYVEYDGLRELRNRAQRQMIAEARKHDVYRIIQSCPGIGEVAPPNCYQLWSLHIASPTSGCSGLTLVWGL